jgi:hypothetical protein
LAAPGASTPPVTRRPNQIRALALGGPKRSNLVSAVPGASTLPVTRRPNQVQEFALGGPKLKNLVRADRLRRSGDWLPWRETRFGADLNLVRLSTRFKSFG